MHGLVDLFWIRIAFLDQAHWQTMRAEHQMDSRAVRELPQHRSNPLNQCLNINWMVVEIIDRAFRWSGRWTPLSLIGDSAPFLHAAQRSGVRIMRIQRQQYDFVQRAGLTQRFN